MTTQNIAVYGAGGSAREVAWLAQECSEHRVVCFIEDDPALRGRTLNGVPTMSLEQARQQFPEARVVGGVGNSRTRERLITKAEALGYGFATLVHPRVERSHWNEIGIGTVICAGSIVTTNVTIGKHVQVNVACTISHDSVLGDYTTLAPGVHVCGWVHAGRRVQIGAGAVLINGTAQAPLVIGDDVVIGAGACVTESILPGVTAVGVPARPISKGVRR